MFLLSILVLAQDPVTIYPGQNQNKCENIKIVFFIAVQLRSWLLRYDGFSMYSILESVPGSTRESTTLI